MAVRNYSSTAVETTLSAAATDSETTLAVASTTGFPVVPFVLCVDAGAVTQELVLVTGVAGTTLTVTRGYDSTVATAHEIGAVVQHSHAAVDFREANSHVNATAAHGTTGAVVGTTDVQTLTNKTLTDPIIEGTEGIGGEWTEWVPTWTNVTVGDGEVVARYRTVGKTVDFMLRLTAGATTTGGVGARVTLPVTPLESVFGFCFFNGSLKDASISSEVPARLYSIGDETAYIQYLASTWKANDIALGAGDYYFFSGTYEIA